MSSCACLPVVMKLPVYFNAFLNSLLAWNVREAKSRPVQFLSPDYVNGTSITNQHGIVQRCILPMSRQRVFCSAAADVVCFVCANLLTHLFFSKLVVVNMCTQ